MTRRNIVYLAGVTAVIVVCVSAARAMLQRDTSDSLHVDVEYAEPASCRVRVEDQSFLLPDGEGELLAALKLLVRPGREVTVAATPGAPYRWVGHAIFTVQRAGFVKIGFIPQPACRAEQKRP